MRAASYRPEIQPCNPYVDNYNRSYVVDVHIIGELESAASLHAVRMFICLSRHMTVCVHRK